MTAADHFPSPIVPILHYSRCFLAGHVLSTISFVQFSLLVAPVLTRPLPFMTLLASGLTGHRRGQALPTVNFLEVQYPDPAVGFKDDA